MISTDKKILIWDHSQQIDTHAHSQFDSIIFWSDYSLSDEFKNVSLISLPKYVEDNAEELKNRFLNFVDRIGNYEIKSRSVIDHLKISPGFSYFWMTLFACKRWGQSSHLIEAVRLLALEEIITRDLPFQVSVSIQHRATCSIIGDWCRQNQVKFTDLTFHKNPICDKDKRRSLAPRPVLGGLALLRELHRRRGIRQHMKPDYSQIHGVFIDHFLRIETKSAEVGKFVSGFWGPLPDASTQARKKLLFLHVYVKSDVHPHRIDAARLIKDLNSKDAHEHQLIGTQLGLYELKRTISIYISLLRARFKLRKIQVHFKAKDSKMNLWRLFEREWFDSLSGTTAIGHSIMITDLEKVLNPIPAQIPLVYLMENQPWELAMLQLCRQLGQDQIIGYPHSTIRFWDLRYFVKNSNDLQPAPPQIAANGPSSRIAIESSGFRFNHIHDVEALSYLYLDKPNFRNKERDFTPVLILGDYFSSQNMALLEMLAKTDLRIRKKFQFTIKAHPLCRIDKQFIESLNLLEDNRHLSEILDKFEIVLSTNGTSASAEAHQLGLSVITILNGATPNFSPLRGLPQIDFVSSPLELQTALEKVKAQPKLPATVHFRVNRNIDNWKDMLSLQ